MHLVKKRSYKKATKGPRSNAPTVEGCIGPAREGLAGGGAAPGVWASHRWEGPGGEDSVRVSCRMPRGSGVSVRVFSSDRRRWDLPLRYQGRGCWEPVMGSGVSRTGRGQ